MRKAIGEQPDLARAHAALAAFLCRAGRADEALTHLASEERRAPSKIWPLSIKAGVLSGERRIADALVVHRKLVAKAPGVPVLWLNFASDLAAAGEVYEAETAYRNAVRISPDLGGAWLGLANLRLAAPDDFDIAAMEAALAAVRDPYQKIQILFALGRGHGARGAFGESFQRYSEANILRAALVPHNAKWLAAFVEAHDALPTAVHAHATARAVGAECPTFIVGMPRSGSTLVEQILSSHSAIEGLGELSILPEIVASAGISDAPEAFVGWLQSLTGADAERLGARYLATTRRYRRTERPIFTDKLPANWRFVALIHRILPEALIIDMRRDPLDCCFSSFTTYFNRDTDFPNSLEDLGSYYRSFTRLMEIMRPTLRDRLYRIDYELLVSDPERTVRSMLDFLRLPFDPACLEPHRNPRAIYTPSAQQVRAVINPRGGNRVRDYMAWLGPLKSALGL